MSDSYNKQPHKSPLGMIRKITLMPGLVLVLILLVLFSLGQGQYDISPFTVLKILLSQVISLEPTWTETMGTVVIEIRLPRIAAGLLVGMGLALSGATYQGMFKNPLVSPDLLGVSAGAGLGASIAILMHFHSFGIQMSALSGGLLAVFLTTSMPRLFRNTSNLMLVLAGIIIAGFLGSMQGILKYIADPETELAAITFWQMGSLATVETKNLLMVMPTMLVAMVVLYVLRWWINILSLGEAEAKTLGMNVKRMRGLAILCSTIITASAVCISGTIGWVGLVIPHLGRMLVGPDNTRLTPAVILLGPIFMAFIDMLARNITTGEIPLSILTGSVGAPFFAWLLMKQRMKIS